MAELYELEMLGRKIGLIRGPKTAGRKPGQTDYESYIHVFGTKTKRSSKIIAH